MPFSCLIGIKLATGLHTIDDYRLVGRVKPFTREYVTTAADLQLNSRISGGCSAVEVVDRQPVATRVVGKAGDFAQLVDGLNRASRSITEALAHINQGVNRLAWAIPEIAGHRIVQLACPLRCYVCCRQRSIAYRELALFHAVDHDSSLSAAVPAIARN